MDNDLELTFIACLDALEAGEPIEQILARYPADAAALRPLLETAIALPALDMAPAPAAQAAARRAFLNQAAAQRPVPRRSFFGLPLRFGLALATVLLALLLVGGTTFASTTALPGDPLYGLKRSVEQVEVALAGNSEPALRRIDQRRRDEVLQLIAAGREEEVRFRGEIEALGADGLIIDGITVTLGPATLIEGEPRVGARAAVAGQTGGTGVRASELRVDPGTAPLPSPTATPTATTSPSATTAPARTATSRPLTVTSTAPPPTSTPTTAPSPTGAPSPRPATPTVAATLAPPPTAEPTAVPPPPEPSPSPEDNSNDDNSNDDNGNDDNGNDNNSNDDNGNDSSGGGDDNSNDDNSNDDSSGGGDDNSNDDNSNDDSGGGDDSNDDNSNDSGG
jgi:hypothetical protein